MENNIKFKPTTEWMQKWYTIMNDRLFGGKLGYCILKPFTTGKGSNGNTLGLFKITGKNIRVKRTNRRIFQKDPFYGETIVTKDNFVDLCKPAIELNANYTASQDSWINTLVHEMCHYYTYMNGFAPKQAHGVEFREIASIVAYKSNGQITIQRLATAEEMKDMILDANIEAKNKERETRKKSKTMAIVVVTKESVELTTTTLNKVLNSIIGYHTPRQDTKYIGVSNEESLIEFLYSKGYTSTMRTYRYWDISSKQWTKDLLPKYSWKHILGSCNTLSEALGIEQINTKTSDMEEYNLGYKIIKDGNGYNLINKSNHKSFSSPVEKIWFDKNNDVFKFKKGKFTFMGTPGHWSKDNLSENTNKKILIESIVSEVVSSFIKNNTFKKEKDYIEINPDMNLGVDSLTESLNEYYYDSNDVPTTRRDVPRISKSSKSTLSSREAHKALSKKISFKNNLFTAYKCEGEYANFYEVKDKNNTYIRFTTHDDYAPENIGDVKFLYKRKIYILDTNTGKIKKGNDD